MRLLKWTSEISHYCSLTQYLDLYAWMLLPAWSLDALFTYYYYRSRPPVPVTWFLLYISDTQCATQYRNGMAPHRPLGAQPAARRHPLYTGRSSFMRCRVTSSTPFTCVSSVCERHLLIFANRCEKQTCNDDNKKARKVLRVLRIIISLTWWGQKLRRVGSFVILCTTSDTRYHS